MEKPNPSSKSEHLILQVFKTFFSKLRQSPSIYPIRYYKKRSRIRRIWQDPSVN